MGNVYLVQRLAAALLLENQMDRMRVGFIGSGFVAKFHARALLGVRDVELVGLLDRADSPKVAKLAKDLGVGSPTIYRSIGEMAERCDVLAILCPNHAKLAAMQEVAAARAAGCDIKGVFCDKPLGRTVAEARQMVALARNAQIPTSYGENQVFMPGINAMRRQLASVAEKMGPVRLARSAEQHAGPHAPWFWDPRLQGGGVMSDMGCHSLLVGQWVLTPDGMPINYLQPRYVTASTRLIKWGLPQYVAELKARYGIDFMEAPAEDYATGEVLYANPVTGDQVVSQVIDSWMQPKLGLQLMMEGMGIGYSYETNTLVSSSTLFIGDSAAAAIGDAESALEKCEASRGQLILQEDEPVLYGYTHEWRDAAAAFSAGHDGYLPWEVGVMAAELVNACYMSAERGLRIDLGDAQVRADLETYQSLISQGRGAEVLLLK